MTEPTSDRWTARYKNHPVHDSRERATSAIAKAAELVEDDHESLIALDRLRSIFTRLGDALNSCDPLLVQESALANLQSAIDPLTNEMATYLANRDIAHLFNANTHADNILHYEATLPVHRYAADVQKLNEAITRFRKSIDGHLATVKEKAVTALATVEALRRDAASSSDEARSQTTTLIEEVRTHVTGLTQEISSQKARLDTAIAQFQQQSSTAEAERLKQFSDGEMKRLETANAAEEQRRVAQTTTQDERKAAFDAFMMETKARFDELSTRLTAEEDGRDQEFAKAIDDGRTTVQALAAELKATSSNTLSSINDEKEKAEKLVHVIGNTGMVGGYQKTANEERISMWIWQAGAVVSMMGFIAVAIVVAAGMKEISWPAIAGRIFVAGAFGVVATYAGRQAAVHRETMKRNRRMELELASLDPYLALLPEEVRHTVKKTLAERLFGQPDGASPIGKDDRSLVAGVADTTKVLAESVKGVVDAVSKKH